MNDGESLMAVIGLGSAFRLEGGFSARLL